MNTNTYQGTAVIYQFPTRSRNAVAEHRRNADAADLMTQRIADALSSCWYHEAAVKQSGGPTKA